MKAVCPKCEDDNGNVMVDIMDGNSCVCNSCGSSFKVDEVRKLLESWGPLLKWLDSHPAR